MSGRSSSAIVFADANRLDADLARYGHLVCMDSTHKTNILGWKLFTIMLRDSAKCYRPFAHFLTSIEDSEIIALCLQQIIEWAPSWRPVYFLTDDSAAERAAVKIAFGTGIQHFLCVRHFDETLRRRFGQRTGYSDTLEHLLLALKTRTTRKSCEESIQAAIDTLPRESVVDGAVDGALDGALDSPFVDKQAQLGKIKDPAQLKYIMKELVTNMASWANYSREQSPLLLQIRTTNANESFHAVLKTSGNKVRMTAFSLKGIAQHTLKVADGWYRQAGQAAFKQRTSIHPFAVEHHWMRKLPFAAQEVVVEQMRRGAVEHSKGNLRNLDDYRRCTCRFFRAHELICSHIWAWQLEIHHLQPDDFESFTAKFKTSGWELFFDLDIDANIDTERAMTTRPITKYVLDFKESTDQLSEKLFEFEERLRRLAATHTTIDTQTIDRALTYWLDIYHRGVAPITTLTAEHALNMIGAPLGGAFGAISTRPLPSQASSTTSYSSRKRKRQRNRYRGLEVSSNASFV